MKVDLEALEGLELTDEQKLERIELIARKGAYKEVLQYIKDSRDL